MKLNTTNRFLLSAIVVAVAFLQSSCSTSENRAAAWNRIQNEGLIPYLADSQSALPDSGLPTEALTSLPQSHSLATFEQPREVTLHHSGVVTAQEVAGKPGFVFSPHTADPLEVDVRDFEPGALVRCPYTKKSFVVPGEVDVIRREVPDVQMASTPRSNQGDSAPAPSEIASQPKKIATPSSPIVAPEKKEELTEIAADSLPLDPEPMVGIPKTNKLPTEEEALALPKRSAVEDVPVGKRVEGKPNYVYSPFAASNQVVDVEGHAPGTKVKCPYTGKVFAVPAE